MRLDRKAVSIVFPYYDNPEMLAYKLDYYSRYSEAMKRSLEIVVVDDASPISPARNVVPDSYSIDLSVFRIVRDRPWNQDAARNIGAYEARGEYLLLTDVDHVVPEKTLSGLLAEATPGVVLTMGRKAHFSDASKDSHVNSYFMSKKTYWDVGGYDEDFWGTYGSDWLFRKRLQKGVTIRLVDDLKLELVTQGSIQDAKNKSFARSPTVFRRIRSWILRLGKTLGVIVSPRVLVNPYVRDR